MRESGARSIRARLARIERAGEIEPRMHYRHVVQRQHTRIGEKDGLAAHLHGELRGADHGRTDALAWIDHQRRAAPLQLATAGGREKAGDVAGVALVVSEAE